MNEEVDFVIESTEEDMKKAIAHLEKQLRNIRAGKANPSMLEPVKVEYYGMMTPLNQVANITAPDGRTLIIQPFEKTMIDGIEKGIIDANLGFNPTNNGDNVIINVPQLTEDRRKELSKQVKYEAEEAKIGIRNDRRSANNEVKKLEISEDEQKDAEDEIQNLTDKYVEKVDQIFEHKKEEIMKV
jgi:ribosome recycling factor